MPDAGDYVVGDAPAQQSPVASFEFKAASPDSTGGGYPRWRSYERRPHTARRGKEDVYVPVHRLAAVAWLFPDDWTAEQILDSGHLVGADVHHELGLPAANLEDHLALLDHGRHSEVTQAQMRAWAADAQAAAHGGRDGEGDTSRSDKNRVCGDCGDESETLCESGDFEGRLCPACARRAVDDAVIEVV